MSTAKNGQTHSNNSPAVADELLSVFDHFVGLALKGLITNHKFEAESFTSSKTANTPYRVPHL